jgi:hypothetical protein
MRKRLRLPEINNQWPINMAYDACMDDKLDKFAELNNKRREDEYKAYSIYRNKMHDYNDALRKAYNEYHDTLEQIEKDWSKKLQEFS